MKNTKLLKYVLLLLLFVTVPIHANPDFTELEKIVPEELKDSITPGAVIAIISGDRVIYQKAFGVANVETGAPMQPEMLFRLGSTTKMFTAAALVTLSEQNKINLNEPDEVQFWTRHLNISREDLQKAIDKVGNSAAAVRKELGR